MRAAQAVLRLMRTELIAAYGRWLCVRVYVRHTVCTYSPDPYLRVEHVYIWKLHLYKNELMNRSLRI